MLKKADYNTVFIGKWHLGEAKHALPINHGYDEMHNETLYHLNAYTYASGEWNPTMSDETLAMFKKSTTGALSGKANKDDSEAKATTDIAGPEMASHIHGLDAISEKAALDYIAAHAKDANPFFMSLNWAKNHQPNIAAHDFEGKSDRSRLPIKPIN